MDTFSMFRLLNNLLTKGIKWGRKKMERDKMGKEENREG